MICLVFLPLLTSAQAVEQPNGTPHQTVLSWATSPPVTGVTVSGYNVYKSSTSGGESGTKAINGATLVSGTTYTDASVTPGATAYYVVEAQSSTGNQSVPSNEVSATTPNNPNPPVLSAAIVSINVNGKKETITASYTDTNPVAKTAYQLWSTTGLLKSGEPSVASSGSYLITWSGATANAPHPSLTVEDDSGNVATTN
jgi:hypothetical protein